MNNLVPIIKKTYNKNFEVFESNELLIEKTWKGKNRLWGDKTHRISSYVAMFSPALASHFIETYSNENDVILDTFSGRGTTLLQARLENRKAYAIDLNPFAYVLSKSKSKSFNEKEVKKRIFELEEEYKKNGSKEILDLDMEIFYSKKNLDQLLFIKKKLGINWKKLNDIDNFILAITLGIMHGPMRKNGDSIYLSLSMSNHTSMSKKYVKKYAEEHNLKKPEQNVFDKIAQRTSYIIKNSTFSDNVGYVKYGNALEIKSYFPNLNPKLVFTSPPYLDIINYTNQNWIKMWMLGFNNRYENKDIGLNDDLKIKDYIVFMKEYLKNISLVCSTESKIILVIGDVIKNEKIYSFEDMWKLMKNDIPELCIEEIYIDSIKQNNKATNSMGSKAGRATRIDKIYVFKIKK